MDKASATARITNWVDSIIAITGFPVVEMINDEQKPQLIEWTEESALDIIAKQLKADEVYGYSGIARLQDDSSRLARIYILLVRRDKFAWKITLSFETACLPGMPAKLVDSNDHIRAGAILGELTLG